MYLPALVLLALLAGQPLLMASARSFEPVSFSLGQLNYLTAVWLDGQTAVMDTNIPYELTWHQSGSVQSNVVLAMTPLFGNDNAPVSLLVTLNGWGNTQSCIQVYIVGHGNSPQPCVIGDNAAASSSGDASGQDYWLSYTPGVNGGPYTVAIGVGKVVGQSKILSKVINTAPPVVRYVGFTTFTSAAALTNVVLSPFTILSGQTVLLSPVTPLTDFTLTWTQSGNTESNIILAPPNDDGASTITYNRGFVPSTYSDMYYIGYQVGWSYRVILGGWGGQACCGRFGDKCMATCPNGVGEPYDVTNCGLKHPQPLMPQQCHAYSDPSWSDNPCSPFMSSGISVDPNARQQFWVQYRRGASTVALTAGMGTPPTVDGTCAAPACQTLCTRDVEQVGSPNSADGTYFPPAQFYTSNRNLALNEIPIGMMGLYAYQGDLSVYDVAVSYP